MIKSNIFVTQPSLPPLEEMIPYLEEIWQSKILTNGGPFHRELEAALCAHLGVPYISLFSNGTIALITALKALKITGEVITTPYSFVATAHSLLWNGIKPIFVDIDPNTLNLDPKKIEPAITPQTTAILPVHVYGYPCDTDAIESIAKKHGLKVIYDSAHAFGVQCHCGSVLNHGDLSVLSFHATKVFNTFEGGAIVCKDEEMKRHIDQLKNFGFTGETSVVETGINGKMNEFSAAFGLLQLKYLDTALENRRQIDITYRRWLEHVKGIFCLSNNAAITSNYSYFPILVNEDYPIGRDALYQRLRDQNIYARRYFYPLISDFPMYRSMRSSQMGDFCPVATVASSKILCLPIYSDLSGEDVERVIELVSGV